MNIIEKLEIKSIKPVKYSDDETPWVGYNPKDIDEIEEQNRELLQALIEIHDAQFNPTKSLAELNSTIRFTRNLIEKAAGQPWDKIEGLI